jgi:hypothetical protein
MELAVVALRMILLFLIAFGSASISFTMTYTSIFKWFRELLSKVHPKVEELVNCPWCFNHWVTIVMLFVAEIDLLPLTKYTVVNFLFTLFVLTTISGLIHYVLLRAYEPVAKLAAARYLEKLRSKQSEQ